ncbi:TPA: hypothetical protein DCQ44_02865 [Candidatus Taylorbacteria bacterium]|nr:hypothetical protein [Candidatus Taylorbacteria bacterium]
MYSSEALLKGDLMSLLKHPHSVRVMSKIEQGFVDTALAVPTMPAFERDRFRHESPPVRGEHFHGAGWLSSEEVTLLTRTQRIH